MAGVKGRSGGHNKKAPQMHIVQGTFRKDRHGDHVAPEPPPGDPPQPEGLGPIAAAEWTRMVARLRTSHALSTVDDAALYRYVHLYADGEDLRGDYTRLRKEVDRLLKEVRKLNGDQLVDAVGKIVSLEKVINGLSSQLRQNAMAIRQYLVEFGMTPASRGRVKLPGDPKQLPGIDPKKSRFFGTSGPRA